MNRVAFSFLVAFAVLFFGLTVTETCMYYSFENALAKQKELQQKMVFYQRLNNFTQQVMQRIAVDSQHDPALIELLRKRQIKVVSSLQPPQATSAPATNAAPTPATPDPTGPAPTSPAPANP